MAITTAPDRSGHTVHHSQPALIAVLIAVLALAVIGVAVLVLGGSSIYGVQGSGVAVTQTRAVASFTGLDLAGSSDRPGRYGHGPPGISGPYATATGSQSRRPESKGITSSAP